MQEANNNEVLQGIRRHGLVGWSLSGEHPPGGAGEAPSTPCLETTLSVFEQAGSGFAVCSTTASAPLPGGGAVAVAGRPRFREEQLAALAELDGPAVALASAYDRFGDELFKLVFGPFAICIIDRADDRVLVGIDRLGQYSLYYNPQPDGILFSTEARGALDGTAAGDGALLPQGIYHYVYFHMVPGPVSIYPGVRKLPAAHFLEYRGGAVSLHNYWLPEFSEGTAARNMDELAAAMRETLRRSLRNSLPSEGRVGCFLSGGLDSSTVAGVMAEVCDDDAEAYSIGFSAEGYDEMAYARITARHFGVKLNEYYVTPEDVVAALPLIATSYDEPFGNSSALPAYFCARMAAEKGVSTLLAGDGGDEIFAGNERYLRQRVFDHYSRVPGFLRRGLIEPVARLLPGALPLVAKAKSYIEQANTPLPDRLQSYNFLHRHAAAEIFAPEFLAEVDTGLPLEGLRAVYRRPAQASDLNRMLYMDWQFTLADNDLRKVSHMCAVAGVDVTYPMLDDELVALSCNVPSEWKLRGDDLRHFFKQSLNDWLPHETIHKNKQGFGLPFGVWMRSYTPLREMAYDQLLKLKNRGFIRPEFIDRAIEMHQSEHAAYYGELVWILTVFELWMDAKTQAGVDPWQR